MELFPSHCQSECGLGYLSRMPPLSLDKEINEGTNFLLKSFVVIVSIIDLSIKQVKDNSLD